MSHSEYRKSPLYRDLILIHGEENADAEWKSIKRMKKTDIKEERLHWMQFRSQYK